MINYQESSLGEVEPDERSLILDGVWTDPVLCKYALLWVPVCHRLAGSFLTDCLLLSEAQ